MKRAYDQMISTIPQIFNSDNVHRPKLIIAIDEAHPLSENQNQGKKYQPAHLLCRAISLYSRHTQLTASIWVVFASTTSKVADFAAPGAIRTFFLKISLSFLKSLAVLPDNSLRISEAGELLFRPYTALGWDQNAPSFESLSTDKTACLGDVIRFGRPL